MVKKKGCQITFEKLYEFAFDKQMAEWQYNLVFIQYIRIHGLLGSFALRQDP